MEAGRNILLVEDDENDVILIQRALQKGGVDAPLHLVRDGDEAIDYFCGTGRYENTAIHPLPAIVLLDLRLPKRSGLEVLEWLKRHDSLALLPVIVFTNSTEDTDIRRAYALGANSYLKKPYTQAATTALLQVVSTYWLDRNERPPQLQRLPSGDGKPKHPPH